MLRLKLNFSSSIVAALSLLHVCFAQSDAGLKTLSVFPTNNEVAQGDAFTVFWDPSEFATHQRPMSVTVEFNPTVLAPRVASVTPSISTSAVFTVPTNAPPGFVGVSINANSSPIFSPFTIEVVAAAPTAVTTTPLSSLSTPPVVTAIVTTTLFSGTTTVTGPQTTNSSASNRSSHTLSVGQISGIAIGSFIILIIPLVLLFWWRRKRESERLEHVYEKDDFLDSLGELTIKKSIPLGIGNRGEKTNFPEETQTISSSTFSERDDYRESKDTGQYVFGVKSLGYFNSDTAFSTNTKENHENLYGLRSAQELKELGEQRNKMRELIEALKKRRRNISSVNSVKGGTVQDLEVGSLTPVRGIGL